MSGKTLGRVGYEAYCRHVDRFSPPPWEHLHSGYQDGWQEVANAVAAHVAGATAEDDSAAEIMRLTSGEHPAIYARWAQAGSWEMTDAKVARLWKSASEADRQFWAQIVTERREDRAELENQAGRGDRLEGQCEDLAAAADQLRERVARAAAALDADALATAPSKKSQIQEDAARRIREAIG